MNLQPTNGRCDLEAIIATAELQHRASQPADSVAENKALMLLVRELSESPENFFQTLVKCAMELSGADSTGISLLDEEAQRFVWPAVSGGLVPYIGGGTPRDFGPCGTVLDRNAAVLFLHPERHFTYLEPITPPLEEVLLIPFHMDGKPVGTIWAVIHEKGRNFTAEDKRLLESLSEFAASAYRVLATTGALQPFLKKNITAPREHRFRDCVTPSLMGNCLSGIFYVPSRH